VLASILCAAGVPWVHSSLDGFWAWFDGSIARLRLFAALIPVAIAFIAYRVCTADRVWKNSDRWWKRAEWALETATDGDYARRTVGMKALTELSELPMADAQDRQLFNGLVVAVRDAEASRLLSLPEDEEMEDQDVDDPQETGRQWDHEPQKEVLDHVADPPPHQQARPGREDQGCSHAR
jgi:hypothetical protein